MDTSIFIRLIAITSFSGFISAITVPFIIKYGTKKNLVDIPDERKRHAKPIVRIGGTAIGLSIFLSLSLAFFLNWIDPITLSFLKVSLIASFVLLILGLADDIYTLSPFYRLTFQVLISIFVWQQGIRLNQIDLSWLIEDYNFIIPKFLSLIITVLWICMIINAFNWLDGLDGLAAGTCVVSSFGFLMIIFNFQSTSVYLLMASLIGSCIGFLLYNFYSAKIYMGDCGSYFIGFLLSIIAIYSSYSDKFTEDTFTSANPFLPIFILLLPIADMFCVILIRISKGKSPFLGDRNHFHHRLLKLKFNHKDSVLFSYVVNQYFVAVALSICLENYRIPILFISHFIVLNFAITKCSFTIKKGKPLKIFFEAKNLK